MHVIMYQLYCASHRCHTHPHSLHQIPMLLPSRHQGQKRRISWKENGLKNRDLWLLYKKYPKLSSDVCSKDIFGSKTQPEHFEKKNNKKKKQGSNAPKHQKQAAFQKASVGNNVSWLHTDARDLVHLYERARV